MEKTKATASLNTIGAQLAGGFVRGHFLFDMKPHAVISAPIAVGLFSKRAWNTSNSMVKGATRWNDGLANTLAMAKAGSPIAKEILALSIKGEKGWYIPSRLDGLALHHGAEGVKIFQQGGAQYIPPCWLWLSTQYAGDASDAWAQTSSNGYQRFWHKSNEGSVLAVRRVIF